MESGSSTNTAYFVMLFDHGDNVGFLVAELAQSSDAQCAHAGFTLHLAGDDEHRHGVGPCAENSVESVDTAGPGGDVDTPGWPVIRA